MKDDRPLIVLDSTCLLGVHRLLRVLKRPFRKLVLPPGVKVVAWPSPLEMLDFALMKHPDLGLAPTSPLMRGESHTQTVLTDEKQKVNDLLGRLDKFGLLLKPDFNQWTDAAEMKTLCDRDGSSHRLETLRTNVLLHLQKEYVSLPLSQKERMRISYQDLDAVAFACAFTYDAESYNAAISDFLRPMAQQRVFEEQECLPATYHSKELDEYLRRVAGGEVGPTEWAKLCGQDNAVVALVRTITFGLAGLAGKAMEIVAQGADVLLEMKDVTAQGLLRILAFPSLKAENAALVEELDRHFRMMPYREVRED